MRMKKEKKKKNTQHKRIGGNGKTLAILFVYGFTALHGYMQKLNHFSTSLMPYCLIFMLSTTSRQV